jgi:YidC/Oxa1 family membrane protein insertase
MQQKRFLLFTALMIVLLITWWVVGLWVMPPKPSREKDEPAKPLRDGALHIALGPWDMKPLHDLAKQQAAAKPLRDGGLHLALGPWDMSTIRSLAFRSKDRKASAKIELGANDAKSKFHLFVVLDARGAGVYRVLLNKFRATDLDGKPTDDMLELVPPDEYHASNLLYHFAGKDATQDIALARPLATLGLIDWKPSPKEADTLEDGRQRQRAGFTTEIDGVEITKVYSLIEGEYHLGLEVRMRKLLGTEGSRWFRYQLTGAKGLPIEGRWFTSTFRNALIATIDAKGNILRDLQDSRQIGLWEGGNEILRDPEHFLRYAGIVNQYFASMIVVDSDQKNEKILTRGRPTLERGLAKGKIDSISEDRSKLVLLLGNKTETFTIEDVPIRGLLKKDMKIALWYHTDPQFRQGAGGDPRSIATKIEIESEADKYHAIWEDDITVRVATEPVELKDDEAVVHKYLLYNGPVKPRLLGYLAEDKGGVTSQQVDKYEDLGLYTMTDYHSPGAMGRFASTIYWTDLVIKCTNVMHWVLSKIHWLIPSLGLSIICLTILVRGMMFPISRKGAMTSIRMQELGPEMKKLQEKFKDDKPALQMATMELYRKHGVNPFGTCWFMFLQMPIFMGLYYALQESITFRLAPFWPMWIENLAAPDMLFRWGESIPWLSTPDAYGGFLYLGPYLNLLPIIAVALMIVQQKLTMPPPTDEQQEMQQKMMKYMMVFMGLMFYKVASGLCLYFIASSLWGFAERKLLPKKKPISTDGTTPTTSEGLFSKILSRTTQPGAASTSVTTLEASARGKQGRIKRSRERAPVVQLEPLEGASAMQRMRRWWRGKRERLSEWWAEVLKQASKKER